MSSVLAFRIEFPAAKPPASGRKPANRRPAVAVAPAQAIAAGEAADRHYFDQHPGETEYYRPVGEDELAGLLQRQGTSGPPNIRKPRIYAVMSTIFLRSDHTLWRSLYTCKRRTWERSVREAFCGVLADGRLFEGDDEHGVCPAIYRDTILRAGPA